MVSFKDDAEVETPDVEFVNLELGLFRVVGKDNVAKDILPAGSNYNRSDRLAFDLSPITKPELDKDQFRALNVKPYWQIYWDGKEAYKVRWDSSKSHHVGYFEVKNKSAKVKLSNLAFFDRTWGHVIILSTEPGGDNNQHKVGLKAFEAGLESELVEYTVMGAW